MAQPKIMVSDQTKTYVPKRPGQTSMTAMDNKQFSSTIQRTPSAIVKPVDTIAKSSISTGSTESYSQPKTTANQPASSGGYSSSTGGGYTAPKPVNPLVNYNNLNMQVSGYTPTAGSNLINSQYKRIGMDGKQYTTSFDVPIKDSIENDMRKVLVETSGWAGATGDRQANQQWEALKAKNPQAARRTFWLWEYGTLPPEEQVQTGSVTSVAEGMTGGIGANLPPVETPTGQITAGGLPEAPLPTGDVLMPPEKPDMLNWYDTDQSISDNAALQNQRLKDLAVRIGVPPESILNMDNPDDIKKLIDIYTEQSDLKARARELEYAKGKQRIEETKASVGQSLGQDREWNFANANIMAVGNVGQALTREMELLNNSVRQQEIQLDNDKRDFENRMVGASAEARGAAADALNKREQKLYQDKQRLYQAQIEARDQALKIAQMEEDRKQTQLKNTMSMLNNMGSAGLSQLDDATLANMANSIGIQPAVLQAMKYNAMQEFTAQQAKDEIGLQQARYQMEKTRIDLVNSMTEKDTTDVKNWKYYQQLQAQDPAMAEQFAVSNKIATPTDLAIKKQDLYLATAKTETERQKALKAKQEYTAQANTFGAGNTIPDRIESQVSFDAETGGYTFTWKDIDTGQVKSIGADEQIWCGQYVNRICELPAGERFGDSLASKKRLINNSDAKNPTVGSVFISDTGTDYGHVGIVKDIDYTQGLVTISEANKANDGKITESQVSLDDFTNGTTHGKIQGYFDPVKAGVIKASQPVERQPEFKNATQSSAWGFAQRVYDSNKIFDQIESEFTDEQGDISIGKFTTFSFTPNWAKSENEQMYQQAKDNFINAVLRRESGAAIGKEEYVSANRQYFPQRGDSEAVIKQKRANRKRVEENIYQESNNFDIYAGRKQFEEQNKLQQKAIKQPNSYSNMIPESTDYYDYF